MRDVLTRRRNADCAVGFLGAYPETTVPVQYGVADVQAFRQREAKETHVLPRQQDVLPSCLHPGQSPAKELRRQFAGNGLHQR